MNERSPETVRPPASRAVRHVLFDADGVLQELPGGWHTAMEPYLGEQTHPFLLHTWEAELPTLRGEGDYLPMLAEHLRAFGATADVWEVYTTVWHNIEVDPRSIELVHAARAAGYGVHLGTNQEQHRAAYMRGPLGYDELFDVSCYSHDLGAAKPDPAFFVEAAARIGDAPESILFVDDNDKNVAGAISAGMRAVHWDVSQGHDRLLDLMHEHGVVVRPPEGSGSTPVRSAASGTAATPVRQLPGEPLTE